NPSKSPRLPLQWGFRVYRVGWRLEMTSSKSEQKISNILKESRHFPPDSDFRAKAHINNAEEYDRLWRRSIDEPEAFWAEQAKEHLTWFEPWQKVLDWQVPHARWFDGGKLNLSFNCLDRHLTPSRKDKPAIIWEGEPGDRRVISYSELHRDVCRFANCL